jgi:hypothetical protein
VDGTEPIVSNPLDVLDEHVPRLEYFDEPDDSQNEAILVVSSPSVIVQVGMSLTRWTCEHEIDRADAFPKRPLFAAGSILELTGQHLFDWTGDFGSWGEVRSVNRPCSFAEI